MVIGTRELPSHRHGERAETGCPTSAGGRFNVLKGKIKIELPKTTSIEKLSKAEAVKMIEAKTPKKKAQKKIKTAKKTTKKK